MQVYHALFICAASVSMTTLALVLILGVVHTQAVQRYAGTNTVGPIADWAKPVAGFYLIYTALAAAMYAVFRFDAPLGFAAFLEVVFLTVSIDAIRLENRIRDMCRWMPIKLVEAPPREFSKIHVCVRVGVNTTIALHTIGFLLYSASFGITLFALCGIYL
jgi:hypothetical protein